jgi:Uma2 family endonuclease
LSADDYIEGAPELVAEVAASSAAYDLHDKKKAYKRNGVQGYIVWQIFENKLDWFYLSEGEYVPLEPDAAGVLRSPLFSGLWLSVPSLLTGNMAQVLVVLQEGLNSPEHAELVKLLSQ